MCLRSWRCLENRLPYKICKIEILRGIQVQHSGHFMDSRPNNVLYSLYITISCFLFLFVVCNEYQVLYLFHCVLTWFCSHSDCIFLQHGLHRYWVLFLCSINKPQENKNYGFSKRVSCIKLYHSADKNVGRQPQWSMWSICSESSEQLLPILRRGILFCL